MLAILLFGIHPVENRLLKFRKYGNEIYIYFLKRTGWVIITELVMTIRKVISNHGKSSSLSLIIQLDERLKTDGIVIRRKRCMINVVERLKFLSFFLKQIKTQFLFFILFFTKLKDNTYEVSLKSIYIFLEL